MCRWVYPGVYPGCVTGWYIPGIPHPKGVQTVRGVYRRWEGCTDGGREVYQGGSIPGWGIPKGGVYQGGVYQVYEVLAEKKAQKPL